MVSKNLHSHENACCPGSPNGYDQSGATAKPQKRIGRLRTKYFAALLFALAFFGNNKEASAYCTTGLGGFTYAWISLVNIVGTTLNNPSGMAPTYYTAWPATGNTTATLLIGSTYSLTTTYDASSGGAISSLWIDWNQNGLFEASEWQQITTNSNNVTVSFTVPPTALPGTTGMRIRSRGTGNPNGATDACSSFGSGETEDYTITIASPVPCAGTPVAGTATSSPATICSGTSATVSLTGQSIASGINYQWEKQDPVTLLWAPITGATSPSYVTPALTVSTAYRATLTCTNGTSAPATSTPVTVNVQSSIIPPYLETFESITSANQLPNCMTATNFTLSTFTQTVGNGFGQINHTAGGSKMGYFQWNSSPDAFFTPALQLVGGSTYRLNYWFVTDGIAGWTSLDAYFGTSPTLAAMTNLIVSVNPGTTTTYVQVTGDFTPPTSGIYYVGIKCTHTTQPDYLSIDDIGINLLPPCSGAPTAGTVSGPSLVCLNSTAALGLTGSAAASGIAYQWQDSVAGVWTDIPGATLSTYTTVPITATHYYRSKVICTLTTDTSYTPAKTVGVNTATLNYFEDFESITAVNQLPNCMTATNFTNSTFTQITGNGFGQVNHTPGGSKMGYFQWNASPDAFFTPALTLQGGSSYRFSYWYVTDGLSGWNALDAYFGTSPSIAGMTNLIGTVSPGTTTTYQQFVGVFTAPTTGVYYLGIKSTHTTNPDWMSIDDIGLNLLPPCTGRPSAGTIVPITPCAGQNFNLSTTGGTNPNTTGGLTYLWQDSTATGWFQSSPTSSNQPVMTDNITSPRTYRLIVTCTSPGGSSDTTPSYRVNLANYLSCYCIPTYSNGSSGDDVTKVVLQSMINTTGTVNAASPNNWHDYSSQQPTPLPIPFLTLGLTDTVKITFGTDGNQYSMIWIDFNHSGIFEPNEAFTTGTNPGGGGTVKIPFTVPLTSLVGLTKLRVRGGDDSQPTNTQACGASNSTFGDAEDYLVNINYPPCTGVLNAGTAVSSETSICKGYTVNVWDTTHEYHYSAISWLWQSTTDGGLTWNAIPGSNNKDTLNNILINGPIGFRLKMNCDVTGDSSFSVPANISIKPPYQCYCYSQSNGGSTDSSDIGAVVIGTMVNSTGGPHILNPTAIRRRTDYTSIPNIVMYANNAYRLSIYHIQRNGIHADARVSVFIDYDNNLQYDAFAQPNSERVFTGISTENNFYIDTVLHVPDAVIPNVPTGLRVILNNDLNPLSPANLGCGPYVSGETEDYVVQFRRLPQGVGGVMNLEDVALYPNPTNGKFTINAIAGKAMDKVEVSVTTIAGQTIMKKTYNNIGNKFNQELDLSEAARGMYFVEIKTTNGDKMMKKLTVR